MVPVGQLMQNLKTTSSNLQKPRSQIICSPKWCNFVPSCHQVALKGHLVWIALIRAGMTNSTCQQCMDIPVATGCCKICIRIYLNLQAHITTINHNFDSKAICLHVEPFSHFFYIYIYYICCSVCFSQLKLQPQNIHLQTCSSIKLISL